MASIRGATSGSDIGGLKSEVLIRHSRVRKGDRLLFCLTRSDATLRRGSLRPDISIKLGERVGSNHRPRWVLVSSFLERNCACPLTCGAEITTIDRSSRIYPRHDRHKIFRRDFLIRRLLNLTPGSNAWFSQLRLQQQATLIIVRSIERHATVSLACYCDDLLYVKFLANYKWWNCMQLKNIWNFVILRITILFH